MSVYGECQLVVLAGSINILAVSDGSINTLAVQACSINICTVSAGSINVLAVLADSINIYIGCVSWQYQYMDCKLVVVACGQC